MAQVSISGIIRDSVTTEVLPYVAVIVKGSSTGGMTDDNGFFNFKSNSSNVMLEISFLGYETKSVKLSAGHTRNLDIEMSPTSLALQEVVIRPKKEKYKKKGNPAVEFVKQMIAHREANDPHNYDYFSYDQYENTTLALNDFSVEKKKKGKKGKFDFLTEFVDTSSTTGKRILPISRRENMVKMFYRKNPESEKRIVTGARQSGIDEVLSRDGMKQMLEEMFREIDIFKNDIPLLLNRFVSPLSKMGPNFYKYYLMDTVVINGQPCQDLGFVPFNSETWGFTGHLLITLDSTWFVQKVIMNVPANINLNFVDWMTISQDFKRLPDGTRLKLKDEISVDFKLTPKSKGMNAKRTIISSNFSFKKPTDDSYFDLDGKETILKQAYHQDEVYWKSNRPENMHVEKDKSVEALMARLRSIPIFYASEKILSTLVSGYIDTDLNADKSKFQFGPMNTLVSGNAIEGGRFRLGGTTQPAFNKRFFLDGYMAYGSKDKVLKYSALAEYSFADKKEYRKEYPFHYIRAEYTYDINQLGQDYIYTSKDNMFVSLKWKKDDRVTYQRKMETSYYRERRNGFGWGISARYQKEYATSYSPFKRINSDQSMNFIPSYNMAELEFKIRYAPNERFYQTRNIRYPITFDAPIITFSHTMASKSLLGSDYSYNKTEIGIRKRFWLSAFGNIDLLCKAGKVWNKVPYTMLLIPNTNLSYFYFEEAFSLLNPVEFVNDQYASWETTYNMNGYILNRVPLLKKLKWREVFAFRGVYGSLSDKNNPLGTDAEGLFDFPEGTRLMNNKPYMEMSVGVENIFKIFRVDYVWRLSHRDIPGTTQNGIRFRAKLSF